MNNIITKILIIPALIACWLLPILTQASENFAGDKAETVVILHGIARTAKSMKKIEKTLNTHGYDTLAISYPSTKYDIDSIAEHLRTNHLTEQFWQNKKKVHFVTHSMGGLVAARYLAQYPQQKIGRVVMLGPPNNGSEMADFLESFKLYQWFYGPARKALLTSTQQNRQYTPYYELGVIAGTKGWPYFVASNIIPGKSDGRVSVKSTKHKEMTDHIEINATHSFMMNHPDVHQQIIIFLRDGKFSR